MRSFHVDAKLCLPSANEREERRFKIIALAQNEVESDVISQFVGCNIKTVYRRTLHWAKNKQLVETKRTGCPVTFTEDFKQKLTAFYCQTTPLKNGGKWTIRWAKSHLDANINILQIPVSESSIYRILKQQHLKPHLSKYYLQITDPKFFPKMEHLLNLFANLPKNIFFFDECPGIQILTRIAPDMPTENRRCWLKEFEYNRNGTLDVMAFLDANTGTVFAKCTFDHKSETFNSIFRQHVKSQTPTEKLHYVMDNLASHCNDAFVRLVGELCNINDIPKLENAEERRQWLQSDGKRIVIHFTPFHGSWLNWVENWFGILNQKCLNGSYDSSESFIEAIYEFVEKWNTLLAHPFEWRYDGKGLQEKAAKRFINVLINERQPLITTYLRKQLLLMINLIKSYWNEIPLEIWNNLNLTLQSKQKFLEKIIESEEKPKVKVWAKEAFSDLLELLGNKFDVKKI